MGKKARNYTDKTIKRLFGLSGNQCAFPGCSKQMVNSNNAKDSNICHIEAANDGGERYNSDMTDEKRADYPNLILLCVQHHEETNDVENYPREALWEMKTEHETSIMNVTMITNPSMLKNTINAIAGISLNELIESESLVVIDPRDKISYNSIKRNNAIIQEYKVYRGRINSLYDELEFQGSIKKERLLDNIKQVYVKIKGKYILDSLDELPIIQENSDDIYDDVYDELYTEMEGGDDWKEDLVFGIQLIMVDAFIRCKILEEPPKK